MSISRPDKAVMRSRKEAFACLERIVEQGMMLDEALRPARTNTNLTPSDSAFIERLVREVLKRHAHCDAMLNPLLRTGVSGLPNPVQMILCMGVVQLHWMAVPAYAAVNTCVELAKLQRLHAHTGMINAVLKRVATLNPAEFQPDLLADTPTWLRKRLVQDYGEAQAHAIVTASFADVTTVDITVKDSSQLAHYATVLEGEAISPTSVRRASTALLTTLSGFAEGAWWVQDVAAAYPVWLIRDLVKGKRVLDACAAPGGKTLQLAALGAAHVTALDRSEGRLKRLHENLKRTGLHADVVCADMLLYQPETLFDVIVLDAPCSATGTLRRHPDLLYHRAAADIEGLLSLQRQMLEKAAALVLEGGYILYCTCSLLHDEGERLSTHGLPLRPVSFTPSEHAYITQSGHYRATPTMLPNKGGMDGFFAALFQRV
jgi:16S rRNA (cytosine967-C5)-methyltransferase